MKPAFANTTNTSSRIFYVNVAGCRLRVKRITPLAPAPPKKYPTLIFLHEGLGCIELWRNFPETVCASANRAGLVYDRKGYAGSDPYAGPWPEDYLALESTTYLPGLLTACAIDDAVLIGHSDGGSIALITAATRPNRVRGVITEAAHIFVEKITLEGIRQAVKSFATTDLKEKLARYHGDNTETVFYRWADRWLSPEFFDWNIEAYLSKITCPLLVLQGADDEYGTAAQVEGIAGQVSGPVETILIPDCGHVPHFQAKDRVLAEMTRFINMITILE
ncbi:MAG: alpha/beta hydrolase [Proteobacteria bacterium]|nr:alpha/beta hydrolase [Pseudomonadota bacterium]